MPIQDKNEPQPGNENPAPDGAVPQQSSLGRSVNGSDESLGRGQQTTGSVEDNRDSAPRRSVAELYSFSGSRISYSPEFSSALQHDPNQFGKLDRVHPAEFWEIKPGLPKGYI